jgi:hypothetical protein
MRCPTCGAATHIERGAETKGARRSILREMNTPERWRECESGHRFKTFELDAAELAELRRQAVVGALASACARRATHMTGKRVELHDKVLAEHARGNVGVKKLAARYGLAKSTVQTWIKRQRERLAASS